LTPRALNACLKYNPTPILTIGDLIRYTSDDLRGLPVMNEDIIKEIRHRLGELHLTLAPCETDRLRWLESEEKRRKKRPVRQDLHKLSNEELVTHLIRRRGDVDLALYHLLKRVLSELSAIRQLINPEVTP
jgi:hypothetical protein